MASPPKISLYASAARPQNWGKLYESIRFNDCSFEIVFVGPNKPKKILPPEFKFIQSYTKPAQCAEIAARNSTGEFLLHCVDDLEFKDSNALDKLVQEYEKLSAKQVGLILSPKLMREGKPFPESGYKLYPESDDCPPIPISLFVKRSLFNSLGGYDINFIASFADTDLAFRALSQMGVKIEFVDLFVEEDKNDAQGTTLFEDYSDNDLTLLTELWFRGESFTGRRSKEVSGFLDTDIIKVSQGRKGRWGFYGRVVERFGLGFFNTSLRKFFKRVFKYE